MAELQRNFLQGIMNKDLDPHFLPDGQYRDALNIIVADSDGTFSTTDGQHNGVVQNYLGNIQMNSSLGLQPDALCIGAISVPAQSTIYWFVTSNDFDAIFEYNEEFDTTDVVLKSTKGGSNVLNFNQNYRITGVNYINGLLFWTDNYNPPRKINIERCKNYSEDGFTEDDISVIVKPPIASPVITLSNDTATTANNLENKFIYFAYRYKYLDDEYSSLSPFSPVAFFPKPFAYDYGVSENISMVNSKNTATISYNTGGANVKEVQLIYIDTLSTNAYIIDNINKQANNFTDNATETFVFQNNKVYTVLPADQVNRLFDNVPLKAQAQDLIGSRLIYGNYTQFFNLVDSNGADIKPAFSLSLEGSLITDNNPHPTFKSNRDYEIGIVYLDDYGRSTTVITPTLNTNTLYIPADRTNYANDIRIEIDKDYAPPAFATYYRFVIKQNKQEYYNIFPLTYFNDGQFKWFLINQVDVDKISIGSYLYLKNGSKTSNIQYKVLDIVSQPANFLKNANQNQPAGLYFKTKIESSILPELFIYSAYNYGSAAVSYQPVTGRFSVAEKAIFYGVGLNNLTVEDSNAYSGDNDSRFYIEISSTGASDTYSVYVMERGFPKTMVVQNQTIVASTIVTITYNAPSVTNPYIFKFSFATNNGHNVGDYWVVNCRNGAIVANASYNVFGGLNYSIGSSVPATLVSNLRWSTNGLYNSDIPIKAGAVISFKIKEPENGNVETTQTFVSTSEYVNIEEWFFEDGAYQKFIFFYGTVSVGAIPVSFRRGYNLSIVPGTSGTTTIYTISQGVSISESSLKYPVYMYINGYRNSGTSTISINFDIQQQTLPSVFETVPTDNNQDIYYELTNTFPIVNGSHHTNFTNQVLGQTSGYAYLNRSDSFSYPNYDFNAFAWSNGVESFRIRDDWNAATMQFSPRANSTVEGYAEQTLVQALTFSGVYQQTTAINRLNEFNLSLGNFKYLDRFFGSIQKLHARDTDLVVFQENKVSKVLYGKNLLSDSIGGGTIASIPEVLGTQIAYTGEYGISENPESFATWGNNMYFTDARRGAVMQLSEAGLFEISSNGMKNWFKNNLNSSTIKLGMLDPYFEHYVLSSNDDRPINPCQLSVSSDNVVVSYIANNNQFAFAIESNTQWSISVPTNDWITLNTLYGVGSAQILVTTTQTVDPRNINVVVSGCNTTITVTINQEGEQIEENYWYKIRNCNTNEIKYSQPYPSPIRFIGDRVMVGTVSYVIEDAYTSDPSPDPKISITFTSESGCPSTPPVYDWYTVVNCANNIPQISIAYPVNTFAIDARVTSGGNTYRVSAKTNTDPGGSQISIFSTGLTGCPVVPSVEWYQLYNCNTGAVAYSDASPIGEFIVGDRVTSTTGYTYTVSAILTSQPIGTLLELAATGETGCPLTFTYYTLR